MLVVYDELIPVFVPRWRREERNSMTENETNAATETSPLLFSSRPDPNIPAENHAYMSPRRLNAPRATRTPTPRATPVVGYIEGYGSTATVPSPIYRGIHFELEELRLVFILSITAIKIGI